MDVIAVVAIVGLAAQMLIFELIERDRDFLYRGGFCW